MQTPFINVDLNTHMKQKYNWKGNMMMTVLSPVLCLSYIYIDLSVIIRICIARLSLVLWWKYKINSLRQYFTEYPRLSLNS